PGAPSASNTVLGRAVRLTMMNVGHTYVGVSDMDTIGSPLKYSLCCAENEAESPWEPYHVSRGFARDASTVTVHFVYGICELHDFRSTAPDDLVQVFATAATNVAQVGTGLWLIGRRADPRSKTEEKEHNTLFICPEHAQVFAKAGWGRREIQAALYRAARLPFRTMILNKEPKAMATAHPELAWLADHPDLPVPVVEEPTCFDIAVVGAAAARGLEPTELRVDPGTPITVAARLNGVPLTLVVDTGADRTVLSPSVIERAGLDGGSGRPTQIVGATGVTTATLVIVPLLDIAGARIGPLTVIVHALPSVGHAEPVDGLLGRDALDAFTLTVDAASGRATLTPR